MYAHHGPIFFQALSLERVSHVVSHGVSHGVSLFVFVNLRSPLTYPDYHRLPSSIAAMIEFRARVSGSNPARASAVCA